MALTTPNWIAPDAVQARYSTRLGGVSNPPYASLNLGDHVGDDGQSVLRNRQIVREWLPANPIWLRQVHGTRVSTPASRIEFAGAEIEADAAVSNAPNEVLAVMTADCLPVLFTTKQGNAIGVAHAGWRGLCAGVLECTIAELLKLAPEQGPEDVLVWLGPAIGPDSFEVGENVRSAFMQAQGMEFPDTFIPIVGRPGKYWANLYLLARHRLAALGVVCIDGGVECTYRDKDRFFSYRRNGETGRFASFIWISP